MDTGGRIGYAEMTKQPSDQPVAIAVGGGFGATTNRRRLRLQAMVPHLLSSSYRFWKAKFLHFQRKYF